MVTLLFLQKLLTTFCFFFHRTKCEKKSRDYEGVETDDVTIIDKEKKKKEPRPSVVKTIGRVFGKMFFISFLFKIVQDVCVFTQPQLLK
jgi:hypothetical protein